MMERLEKQTKLTDSALTRSAAPALGKLPAG